MKKIILGLSIASIIGTLSAMEKSNLSLDIVPLPVDEMNHNKWPWNQGYEMPEFQIPPATQQGVGPSNKNAQDYTALLELLLLQMAQQQQQRPVMHITTPQYQSNNDNQKSTVYEAVMQQLFEKTQKEAFDIGFQHGAETITAIDDDNAKRLETIIEQYKIPVDICIGDRSLLGYAAYHGKVSCVKALLRQGANSNFTKTEKGYTPLHHACANRYNKPDDVATIVRCLLNAGAQADRIGLRGELRVTSHWLANRYEFTVAETQLAKIRHSPKKQHQKSLVRSHYDSRNGRSQSSRDSNNRYHYSSKFHTRDNKNRS